MIANSNLFAVATLVLVAAIVLPGVPINPVRVQPVSGIYAFAPNSVAATLSTGAPVGLHPNDPFYAVVYEGSQSAPKSQSAFGSFLNSTPITWIRLGGGGDSYDPTLALNYIVPPSGSGAYQAVSGSLVNFTWFQSWCDSLTPHCKWLSYLPGEQNDTKAAVHVAKWYHDVLGFVPDQWQFGNEPGAWTHYGKNLTKWSTKDNSTPSALDYATMVHNYIAAVSALYPSDRFTGIEDACACGAPLITTLASVDGPELAGIAYHNYPWLNGSSTMDSQFYGALESVRALPNTSSHFRSLISAGCSTCAGLPIQVGEYNAGPVPTHSPLLQQYEGAVLMAASVIQAVQANISMFTIFNSGSLINSTTGALYPQGVLYQRVLKNMTMGVGYPVDVSAPGVGGLYGLLMKNGAHESLLIVNTNTTRAIGFTVPTNLFPVGKAGSMFYWNAALSAPGFHLGITLPAYYAVPGQGMLLIDNY